MLGDKTSALAKDQVFVIMLGDETSALTNDQVCVFVLGDKTSALGTRSVYVCWWQDFSFRDQVFVFVLVTRLQL